VTPCGEAVEILKNFMKKKKAVIVSGYFNPIHKGHLEYFNNAKSIADYLFVIVNSDFQRNLKGSKEFQNEEERLIIVSNIKAVDKALISIDKDRTVCATLEKIANDYSKDFDLTFANGGDQNNDTIPEKAICKKVGINIIDGLGDKIQSSSWLLKKL
jgi:D-beta-D-heptose 7-phosphate kinase/D-beta-D-heptose 1-phosphate adenosyltransferase